MIICQSQFCVVMTPEGSVGCDRAPLGEISGQFFGLKTLLECMAKIHVGASNGSCVCDPSRQQLAWYARHVHSSDVPCPSKESAVIVVV